MPDPFPNDLNLWKNRLGHVPEWVWERTKLETLILVGNDLSEVSNQIGRMRTLRTLDLGHNRLTTLPDALGDLDALSDFLYLHDNNLTSLPPSLERLTRLRYLNISENAFEVLPECVCGMAADTGTRNGPLPYPVRAAPARLQSGCVHNLLRNAGVWSQDRPP